MSFGITQTKGRPVTIKEEGVTLESNVSSIDFAGRGVAGSKVGSDVTENIPGTGLMPTDYDYTSYARDVNNYISSVTFKTGGSGGTTVGTLVITRDANNYITTIVSTIGSSVVTATFSRDGNNYITSITKT